MNEPLAAYVPAETGQPPRPQWRARVAVVLLVVAGFIGVEAFLASQSSVALTGSRSCTNANCTTPAASHSGTSGSGTTGSASGAAGAASGATGSGGSSGATGASSGSGSEQSASSDPGSSHGSLALTGLQVALLVILALALLTAGGLLFLSSRRRRQRVS